MNKKFVIKKILIPFDFSETAELALEHAVFMAKLHRADIYLLHVIESYSFTSAISQAFGKSQTEFEQKIESSAQDKLKELTSKLHHDSGMTVNFRIENGKIYKSIVNVSEELDVDVILMGTHGVSGFQEFLIGSNTYRVVMSAPCPVISVQTHAKKIGFKNIVLPIDNSAASRQKVKHAVEIAKHYNSVVHIAGMATMTDVDILRRFDVKIHQVKEYLDEHEVPYTVKMFKGDNAASITMDFATQVNADLIIMMTDQEGGGLFIGNFAQQIINHSKIPVMSIRPDEGDPDKISLGY
ncbi:MAG TPA: universal stress protein [Bacteroidia bacterium]|nr:universal stress protein [Bacteroidia bacterium]HNS11169.1 universal stress protein [Bacteroidia bacterium]